MKKLYAFTTTLASLLVATSNVHAAEPLALQQTMKDLGKNMQIVTDGISREDWVLVEKTAHLIAEHAQPPLAEKMRIMRFMGSNMGKFKAFDEQAHEAAHEMAKSVQEKEGKKVISAFQSLQSACLSCHQTFRPAFVEHFYGKTATNGN